jgi:beta-glucosidase/6-phospho-beta-glucosidase/beta-galactosidase
MSAQNTCFLTQVVPWGLRKLLNWIKRAYGNIPVLVTGNGYSDSGETEDTTRIKYIIVSGKSSIF